jgi:glycosyltransferase involved in cell wall biosynthesis
MINIHLYPSEFRNESRILREAHSLAGFGIFERIDLLGVGAADLPSQDWLAPDIQVRRIGTHSESAGLLGKVTSSIKWGAAIFREYRRVDLACINCHSVSTLPLACLLKWATGAKLVYDAHELETETSGLHGLRKQGTKLVERLLIPHADYSTFVGSAINRWYREEYGLTNTAVVYNCPAFCDIEASDRFREAFGILGHLPIFLYQGVISEARGVPKLVEAFDGLRDKGVLIIMGYGELVEWIIDAAKDRPNVFYHPAVPPQELLGFTAAADFGLSVIEATSLSYEYCMPNKLFEYLMARKPVLVSPTCEQRLVVEQHGIGEVVSDTGAESIRKGVLSLLAKDLSVLLAAIDRVRGVFCWENQEAVLRGVYMDELGFKPRDRES